MWLSINSFRGFPTLGKCYFTWPLVYLLWLLFIDVWLFLLLGLIVLGGLSVRTRMVDHFGPRCSFLMSIYDSSSPVLFLNLGHWMWDPLAWVSPPTTHTFTFQAIESVSYFSFHSLRKSFTFNLLNRSRQFLKVHLYVISFFFLRLRIGAGESAQWSGVLTAPEEGLSSVSNTCAGCWQVPLWAPVLTDVYVCIIKN